MTRRLLLSYVVLTLGVLVALEVPLGILNAHNLRQDLRSKVQRDAVTLGSLAEDSLEHRRPARPRRRAPPSPATRKRTTRASSSTGVGSRRHRLRARRRRRRRARRGLSSRRRRRERPRLRHRRDHLSDGVDRPSHRARLDRARVRRRRRARSRRSRSACCSRARSRGPCAASRRRPSGSATASSMLALPRATGPTSSPARAHAQRDRGKARDAGPLGADFVADASHQLRTPLTALRLRLENLEQDVSPDGRESLAAAVTETDRLSRLVSELLALARARAGRARGAVDVSALAEARAEAWDAFAAERSVRIETVARRSGRGRRAGASTGARQPARERRRGVSRRRDDPRHVGATQRLDRAARPRRGPGPFADARTRAFDRFWHAGPGEGSGLGLAIARRLVGVDEGEIELNEASRRGRRCRRPPSDDGLVEICRRKSYVKRVKHPPGGNGRAVEQMPQRARGAPSGNGCWTASSGRSWPTARGTTRARLSLTSSSSTPRSRRSRVRHRRAPRARMQGRRRCRRARRRPLRGGVRARSDKTSERRGRRRRRGGRRERTRRCLALGLRAFVVKRDSGDPERIAQAVRHVARGDSYFDREVQRLLVDLASRTPTRLEARLTSRELELVPLVAAGLRNREVASQLGVSEQTIRNHLTNIYRKLGTTNRTQMTAEARRRGLFAWYKTPTRR